MEATLSLACPVQSSAVDRAYTSNRQQYLKCRREKAIKLRRQLVRRRARMHSRLSQSLSQRLRDELNIRLVMDSHYLRQPDFVGVFADCGQQWTIYFQPRPLGGRWFFRSSGSKTLYSCSFRHLETQLCYALGQCRREAANLACA